MLGACEEARDAEQMLMASSYDGGGASVDEAEAEHKTWLVFDSSWLACSVLLGGIHVDLVTPVKWSAGAPLPSYEGCGA